MKRLTLMRHADARWNDPAISDLERPLNRRGIGAAQAMARRLLELQLIPDLLLTSPARRTQQTADIVARELSLPARRVRHEEALYLASAADMLKLVQATGPRVAHLLVVAHNPGVSELVQLLLPARHRRDGHRGGVLDRFRYHALERHRLHRGHRRAARETSGAPVRAAAGLTRQADARICGGRLNTPAR